MVPDPKALDDDHCEKDSMIENIIFWQDLRLGIVMRSSWRYLLMTAMRTRILRSYGRDCACLLELIDQ
jgi:hypothetical protein